MIMSFLSSNIVRDDDDMLHLAVAVADSCTDTACTHRATIAEYNNLHVITYIVL